MQKRQEQIFLPGAAYNFNFIKLHLNRKNFSAAQQLMFVKKNLLKHNLVRQLLFDFTTFYDVLL